MGKGTPISQELKENIADDLALGYSFADIADRYGVSYSTIRRVKNNSPETVSTPIEPVPEDIKDSGISAATSIPEPAEKVKTEPDIQYRKITDCDGQYRTEPDCVGQTEQPNNSRQLDYEGQREYIADILKATLEDIDEEIRSFEERIEMLQASLEERRLKQAYLRDFIKSMR
jgi:transcriptional regulator with XRE-family HTH domain